MNLSEVGRYLTEIEHHDVADLRTRLADPLEAELGRVAAFRELARRKEMTPPEAEGLLRIARVLAEPTGHLRRVIVEYLASLEEVGPSGERQPAGVAGAAHARGPVQTRGVQLGGWRALARQDPSPAVRRLARMRD